MNKHFSAICEIMDRAAQTPEAITLTETKKLIITAADYFDCDFLAEIKTYCEANKLTCERVEVFNPVIFITHENTSKPTT